ncbi:PHD finger protein 20-like isoform X2 [Argonauta hians]
MASNKAGNDDQGGGSEEEGSSSASPGTAADDKEEGGGGGGGSGGGGGRITRQSSLRNGSTTTTNADTNTTKEKNNNNGVGSAAGVGAAVKKKRTNSTSSDGGGGGSGGYSVATSRSRRLPCRPGIVWGIGERLEAMDFIHKWYPAKIVSIHEEKFLVLIHFEGWNSRYDEWVDMKCERLRPATRRSERKEKRKQMPCYKAGEHVLAKWSDSKMYPAKILDVKLPAGYEVLFYDGFTRMVQPSHIQTLPPDAKRMDPIPIAAATTTTTTRSAGKVCPSTDSKDDQAEGNPSDGNATLPGYSAKKERGERRERKEVKVEVEAELEVKGEAKERTKKKEKEEEKEVTEEKEKESEKKECGRKSSGQPSDQVLPVANGPTLTDTKTTVTTTTTTTTLSTDMKASVGVAVSTGAGKKEKGSLPSKSGPASPAEISADTPGGGRGGGAEQKKKGGQQLPPSAPSTKSKGSAPPTPHPRTEPLVNSETSKVKELAEELAKPVVIPANLTEDKKKEVPTTEETVAPKAKEKKANLFPTRRRQKLIVAGAFLAKRDASRKSPLSPAKKTAAATAATTSAKSKAAALRMDTAEKADDKGVDKRTTSTASSSSSSSTTDRRTGFRDARVLEEQQRATTDKRPERRLAGERRSWHSSSSSTNPASAATAAPGSGAGSTTTATHSGRFQKQAAQHANSGGGGGGGGGVDGKGPLLKMVDRPVAEMKELEKALTIGFLPNTRPGMAPLSSAVTPSTAYLNMMTATTNMYGDPVVSPAPATKSALGRKVRTRPGAHRPGRKRGLSKPPDPTDLSVKKELPVLPVEQGLARKRMKLTGKVASQEFTIQDDHNPYKCMFANCNKSFRKDHRLQYHIKYYHMEENGKAMLQSPATVAAPTTKRHKTSPLGSVNSDHHHHHHHHPPKCVQLEPPVPPKRRYHPSQLAPYHALNGLPSLDTPSSSLLQDDIKNFDLLDAGRDMVPTPVTVKEKKHGRRRSKNIERPTAAASTSTAAAAAATNAAATAAAAAAMESVVEEFVEFEMEDTSSEVIHCVCNQVEEKGLMIQCEVCMCWQHASCMNLDEATLPKKYICSICQNPRGVRPSSKYIYDQDWLKLGQLPGFSFVESRTDHSDTVETILATNTLVGDLHNIIAVLYGIKRQIKLSLSNDKSGLKLWTKNWSVLASQQQQQQEQQQQQQQINKSIAESLLLRREPSFRDPVLIDPQLPAEILDDQQDSDTDEGEPVQQQQQQQGNDKDSQHASLDSNNSSSSSRTLSDQKHSGLDSSSNPAGLSSSSSSMLSAKSPHLTNGGKIPGQLGNSVNDPDSGSKKSGDMKRGPFVVDNCGSGDGEPKLAGNNNNNSCKPSITDGDGGVKVANSESPPDPLQQYQTNLLQYVMQTQKELDHRLDSIGEQIERLEDKEKISTPLSSDLPLLRKSLRSMMNDLGKVRKMAAYQ